MGSSIAWRGALVATLAVVASCGSASPLAVDAGSSGDGGAQAGAGGAQSGGSGGGAASGGGGVQAGGAAGGHAGAAGGTAGTTVDASCRDPYSQSNQPSDPCAVDTDCQSNFLACRPSMVTVCRDSNGGSASVPCLPPQFASAPPCPTTASVSVGLCVVRYQLPCAVDADCGPAGFACDDGICQQTAGGPCVTGTDCLIGWSCYDPCPCNAPPSDASPPPPPSPGNTRCEPPFATFSCPVCP